jgi:hypothetical protein
MIICSSSSSSSSGSSSISSSGDSGGAVAVVVLAAVYASTETNNLENIRRQLTNYVITYTHSLTFHIIVTQFFIY